MTGTNGVNTKGDAELMLEQVADLPVTVNADIHTFMVSLEQEPFDMNSLKTYGLKNVDVVRLLKKIFKKKAFI